MTQHLFIMSEQEYNPLPNGYVQNCSTLNNTIACNELTIGYRIDQLNESLNIFYQSVQGFHENFNLLQNLVHKHNSEKQMKTQQMIEQHEMFLNSEFQELHRLRKILIDQLRNIIWEYDQIQSMVLNELKTWQCNQVLSGNGAEYHNNLNDIESNIRGLTQIICNIINFGSNMNSLEGSVDDNRELMQLVERARELLHILVLSSFIVENQPPQVIKKKFTKFQATIRWLIGSDLGIQMNRPIIDCVIISEAQASLRSRQTMLNPSQPLLPGEIDTGEIENNTRTMEFNSQTHCFSANFENIQLTKIKRCEKRSIKSVTDEKFALLFYTTVTINNNRILVWTLSWPVVVIVHINQELQSLATITWDNAFSTIGREPFQVPDKVSWSQFSNAINVKFQSMTGMTLTRDHLNCLYEKLFPNDAMIYENKCVTWTQFCKDVLPGRTFTFWEWFFDIMKLTKDHIQVAMWNHSYVAGFISDTNTLINLNQGCNGIFLIRFSDSERGAVTIVFKKDNIVEKLRPWTARDLQIRPIADYVLDLPELTHVYPFNMDKRKAFGQFCTLVNVKRHNGYVVSGVKAYIPDTEGIA